MSVSPQSHPSNFAPSMMVNALRLEPNRVLIEMDKGDKLTCGDILDYMSRYARAFQSVGLRQGARIAMLSANRIEVLLVGNGAGAIGATIVPLHPMGAIADYLYIAEDAGIEALIFDPARFEHQAGELQKQSKGIKTFLSLGPSTVGTDLLDLVAKTEAGPFEPPKMTGNEITRLSYSGGTTGKPKAITGDARNGAATLGIMLTEWEWPINPVVLVCAPLSHSGAALLMPTLIKRGRLVVIPQFEPVAVMDAIERHRINCTLMVPTMIYALLDHPRFKEFDLSSLETIFYGASLMSPARLKEAIEKMGQIFFQFYGQAEAPMTVTTMRKSEHDPNNPLRMASCGRPVPQVDVALLDHENNPVADGEPGEICVRGNLVMNGYLNRDEMNEEAFAGGWLHTGDVAVKDPDGFLRIVDRKKDMIVTGGFNVYPREVEDVISAHPAVAQVSVIGTADEKWGEAVTACIVLRPGQTVDPQIIMDMVREQKGRVQTPKRVEFIDAIPQTPVGKPDKKALRTRFATAA